MITDNIVRIKYDELLSKKNSQVLFQDIERAYGKDGLGILIIQGVPNYLEQKNKLFRIMHTIVNLPDSVKKNLERPDLNYGLGYSFGKEYFGDKPDFLKASYYAQLLQYSSKNPQDYNIWPKELPELKQSFFDLGGIIRNIGFVLLDVIDNYIKNIYPKYNLNYRRIIEDSKHNTGRMLYYFPKKFAKNQTDIDQDNWCEWHNDHGSLTGLASASYVDESGSESGVKLTKTGLYIQNRKGEVIRATYGKDDIAYQLGETLQIHSGGILHATPHAVKVLDDIPENIGRCTFALFMEPNRDEKLLIPEGASIKNIMTSNIYKVPKLQERFKEGMTFGEFNDVTLSKFAQKN